MRISIEIQNPNLLQRVLDALSKIEGVRVSQSANKIAQKIKYRSDLEQAITRIESGSYEGTISFDDIEDVRKHFGLEQ
jgi:hypothetical protein